MDGVVPVADRAEPWNHTRANQGNEDRPWARFAQPPHGAGSFPGAAVSHTFRLRNQDRRTEAWYVSSLFGSVQATRSILLLVTLTTA